jgi:hypothetical protein
LRVLISGSRTLAYQLPGRLPRKASVALSVSMRAPKPFGLDQRRTASAFSLQRCSRSSNMTMTGV